jgi:hypothetical protein
VLFLGNDAVIDEIPPIGMANNPKTVPKKARKTKKVPKPETTSARYKNHERLFI